MADSGWCLSAGQPSGEVVAVECGIQDLDGNEPEKSYRLDCAHAFGPLSPPSSLLIKENICERHSLSQHCCRDQALLSTLAMLGLVTSSCLFPRPILASPPGKPGTGCLEFKQTERIGKAAWEIKKGT